MSCIVEANGGWRSAQHRFTCDRATATSLRVRYDTSRFTFWVEKGGRKHRKEKSILFSAIKLLAQVHTIQL